MEERTDKNGNNKRQWEPLMTPAEAAAHLRIHTKSVIRLARTGALPGLRLGKHWRFRYSDLVAWEADEIESSSQPSE
jgi:excisionase family DNA binding protein